jgi:hypothetical protein
VVCGDSDELVDVAAGILTEKPGDFEFAGELEAIVDRDRSVRGRVAVELLEVEDQGGSMYLEFTYVGCTPNASVRSSVRRQDSTSLRRLLRRLRQPRTVGRRSSNGTPRQRTTGSY